MLKDMSSIGLGWNNIPYDDPGDCDTGGFDIVAEENSSLTFVASDLIPFRMGATIPWPEY